jgi:hypothetical protein
MRQVCNLAYAMLIEGRSKPQIAELEVMLTEPSKKDEMIQRQNAEAMEGLLALPQGGGLLVPMPRRDGPPAGGPKRGDG